MTKSNRIPITARTRLSPVANQSLGPAKTAKTPRATATLRPVAEPPARAAVPPVEARPAPAPDLIARYIELEIEARQCADLDKLRLAIVNATSKVAEYDQAFLVEPALAGGWSITRASSVATFDKNAPTPAAIARWLARPEAVDRLERVEVFLAEIDKELAQSEIPAPTLAHPKALWLPLRRRDGTIIAGLLGLRTTDWNPQTLVLLSPLIGAYAHAWEALLPNTNTAMTKARRFLSKRRIATALLVAAAIAAVVPVPMSALAPAEVVAETPSLVTAPIEGVIGDILLPPGSAVERGQPIVRFVDMTLRSDVEVAKRHLAVAKANHFRVVQSSTATQKNMEDLATTKAEYDVARAELDYAEQLLSRSVITAPASGLLIYSAKSDLIGRPVAVGERLMEIGDPKSTEIKIELPVSDAIALKSGGDVALFLDGNPLQAIPGVITRISYRPAMSAHQQLVYRVHARFAGDATRSIGLRGVARVSGDTVPLGFFLFRRPIAAVRQWAGL